MTRVGYMVQAYELLVAKSESHSLSSHHLTVDRVIRERGVPLSLLYIVLNLESCWLS